MATVLDDLRGFASSVLEMTPDQRLELRADLEGVFADDARPMSTRVRAHTLASVVGVVEGEDQATSLAAIGDVLGMAVQLRELRELPSAPTEGSGR